MNPCDEGYEDPDCIFVSEDTIQWRAFVSVVMNFSVSQKVDITLFTE
jgi:hypothetical protein